MSRCALDDQVTVGGLRLHVSVEGRGEPLLLVNGIGANLAMWRPLRDALPDVKTIAYDAPGTGRSATAPLPATMRTLAWLALKLLDTLDCERVDVLGYSFGGAVAQQLAHIAPDRVRRVVLAATMPGWGGVPGTTRSLSAAATPLRYYSRAYYRWTAPLMAGGHAHHDPDLLSQQEHARFRDPPSVLGYAWQLWALTTWTSMPWLHTVRHPTLVVTGDDDRLVPAANSHLLASHLPNARLLIAPGEGHYLLLDPHSAALPSIRSFLTAADHRHSAGWNAATAIEAADAEEALRRAGSSPTPLALVNGYARRLFSRLEATEKAA